MESHIPTRPTSDLHHRLSARKKPLAAIETQHKMWPEAVRRSRQRSSSFSAIGKSLSRLLPTNRRERGGTLRPNEDESRTIIDSVPHMDPVKGSRERGQPSTIVYDERERRRAKSWSPKKTAQIGNEMDVNGIRVSKLKKPELPK